MSKKLPVSVNNNNGSVLSQKQLLFRITIEEYLDNGFEFKNMTREDIISFHQFLAETVYKKLTISYVDKLFLRKQGLSNAPPLYRGKHELLHYGKDKKSFRIFGYYNQNGYFVLCRIDSKHQTHK